jgi:hypothetical protein
MLTAVLEMAPACTPARLFADCLPESVTVTPAKPFPEIDEVFPVLTREQ